MDNNNFYKNFESSSNRGGSTIKTIILSFFFGLLGSLVLVGILISVPQFRNSIFSNVNTNIENKNGNVNVSPSKNIDSVSVKNFSDTAIYSASKILPSIVGITVDYNVTSNNMFYGPIQSTAKAEGSGIIISDDGYILTNNHIINSSDSSYYYQVTQATNITVYLYNDSTPYTAKVIGSDSQTDLAIIKIDKNNLTAAEIGDSSALQIGEFVLAAGNPLGVGTSVSSGIISALDREITSDGVTYNLIQTDAAINSGNSGGALVNSKGQVVGINTLKAAGSGIEGMGFAIPINNTKDVYKQLIENGKVLRPYIGISTIDLDKATADRYKLPVGVYIKSIESFSPAEKFGLKVGDVITSIDDIKISNINELDKIKNEKNIGDSITIGVYRDSKNIEISLVLGEQP